MIKAYDLFSAIIAYIQPMIVNEIAENGMTLGTTVNRNEVTIDLKPMSAVFADFGMMTIGAPKTGYWLRLDAHKGVHPRPDSDDKTNEDCWMIEQSIMSMTFTKAARFNRIYIFDDGSAYHVPCENENKIESAIDRDFMRNLCEHLKEGGYLHGRSHS